jgi:hypothetical protein
MPAGVPTPAAKVEEFRAHYLYSGNASESAREVGIPIRTGSDLARGLADDKDFASERRKLRVAALAEVECMVMRVMRVCEQRVIDPHEGKVDTRDRYAKVIVDAHKSLSQAKRFDAEAERPDLGSGPLVSVHMNGRDAPAGGGSVKVYGGTEKPAEGEGQGTDETPGES